MDRVAETERVESAPPPGDVSAVGEVVSSEDVQSRSEQKLDSLFAQRVFVYPKSVKGQVRTIKWWTLIGLLAIYYITPLLRWDRGPNAPDQAVLIDMPARRAYFFFIEIWPQEVYYLTGLLLLGALGLFLVTSLFGRIWCGYTCPQTVWTDLFMLVERKVEGERAQRMALNRAPWSASKLAKKSAKHGIWLFISLLTGGAWVMYFNDAPTMLVEFFTGEAGAGVYFFVGLFTFTTYLLAGWAREQVCTYMCPWPRFQAALLDEDSMVVTYEAWRGEPRGKYRKGDSWDDRGDCIDCKQCVAVCPTGIDIRDGIQLECIGCGLCMDACNNVMDRVGRPRKLITFDSERNTQLRAEGKPPVRHLVRMRTIVYVVLIGAIVCLMLFGLLSRSSVDLNVLHDRNPLFVKLSDGSVRNAYTFKILNKAREPRTYVLQVEGLEGAGLRDSAEEEDWGTELKLSAHPDTVATHRVLVRVPRAAITDPSMDVRFRLTEESTGEVATTDTVFRGPSP